MQSAFFFYLMSTVFSGTKADDIGFYTVSSAGTGLLMLAVGVFFYYCFKRKESKPGSSSSWTIDEDVEGIEEEDEDENNDHDDDNDDDNDDDDEEMRFLEENDFSPRQYPFTRRRSRGRGHFVPRGNYWKEKNYYNQRKNSSQSSKWRGRGGYYGRRMDQYERPESPDEWPKLQMGHYSAIVIVLAVLIGLVVSNVIGSTCACCVGAGGVILVIAHAFFCC